MLRFLEGRQAFLSHVCKYSGRRLLSGQALPGQINLEPWCYSLSANILVQPLGSQRRLGLGRGLERTRELWGAINFGEHAGRRMSISSTA
jgi:hypothetical protein